MNNSEILQLVFRLKDKIEDSSLYKEVKNCEKEMLDDFECFKLLNNFQLIQSEYNEMKRFEKYGTDMSEIYERLSKAKADAYNNCFVKKYVKAYNDFSLELKNIEKIIFKDIIREKKTIKIEQ